MGEYHWVWYILGFIFAPRTTFMVLISVYCKDIVPLPLLIIGWIIAVTEFKITVND